MAITLTGVQDSSHVDLSWVEGVLITDSFNRTNSNTTMGNTDTGETWTYAADEVMGIISNTAYCVSNATGGKYRALISSGISDIDISCKFSTIVTNQRIIFRHSDTSNEFMALINSNISLAKRVANVYQAIDAYTYTPANGDVIRVTAYGSAIKVYVNGIERISQTETFNRTATKHGIGGDSETTARFDDFSLGDYTA